MTEWDWHKSQDEEDVATLEPFAELSENEVVKLVLPLADQRGDKTYRCCRKDTFVNFCKSQKMPRWAHSEERGDTVAFFPTPLVGIDMSEYDVDFVLRLIEGNSEEGSSSPVVLHADRIFRISPENVKDPIDGIIRDQRQYVVVNLYQVEEAKFERCVWQALDNYVTSLSRGHCPKGHKLVGTNAVMTWVCDGCERHFTRASRPYRCLEGCNYDLCKDCVTETRGTSCDVSLTKFAEDMKRMISDSACACKLPLLPPRDTIWNDRGPNVVRTSDRVSKWNALGLDPELAAGIRSTFMTCIGVPERSEAWTSFKPGTGEAMLVLQRSARRERLSFVLRRRGIVFSAVLIGVLSFAVYGLWQPSSQNSPQIQTAA